MVGGGEEKAQVGLGGSRWLCELRVPSLPLPGAPCWESGPALGIVLSRDTAAGARAPSVGISCALARCPPEDGSPAPHSLISMYSGVRPAKGSSV